MPSQARPTPLSGFPEWLPQQRLVEQRVLDDLRRTFELHGFANIETRAVEPVEVLLSKGEIDKEVYGVRRLHAEADSDVDLALHGDSGSRVLHRDSGSLALHYDLTVPFARYVAENAGKLQFPFKRYQIQKAWRGERPQDGRFREFVQADIDVVDRDELSFAFEVELPLVIGDAFARLPLGASTGRARMHVNNRKLAEGFYRGLGIEDTALVLRSIDKLDKIGPDKVAVALVADGLTGSQAAQCLSLAEITAADDSFVEQVRALGVENDLLDVGLEELSRVVSGAAAEAPGFLIADLKIARGLDYYTGTVYETVLEGHETLGSVCSGGRYDNLATVGATAYPGVGLSVGVSRLVSRLLGHDLVRASRQVPTCVLVVVTDEERRPASTAVAQSLRARGIPTEVSPSAAKFGRQIRYADRRGIPFVWFPGSGETDGQDEVKDIRSGTQVPAAATTWNPPAEDIWPSIITTTDSGAHQ